MVGVDVVIIKTQVHLKKTKQQQKKKHVPEYP